MRETAVWYLTRARGEILVYGPAGADDVTEFRLPAAEVAPSESPAHAAIRHLRALTGLTDLTAPTLIGVHDHSPGRHDLERRHFVWFEALGETLDEWTHHTAAGVSGVGAARLRFIPLGAAPVDGALGARIPRLCERLSCEDVAVCYITRGDEILAFDGHPGGGIQIVAGRLDAGETPERAAVREAYEEAGLALSAGEFLGTQEWHHRGRTDVHEFRYYFWFRVSAASPDGWSHRVSAGDADAGRVFAHRFVPAASARIDWDLDAYLPVLLERLAGGRGREAPP
jgi:8-oxo-dGTP pyrophosphatase MutT (NUDIX family)